MTAIFLTIEIGVKRFYSFIIVLGLAVIVPSPETIFRTQLFFLFDFSKFKKYLLFFSRFSYQFARERIIVP